MRRNDRFTRGFTLIELVIVIAVIAILAALLVPTILNQTERARASRAKEEVGTLAKSLARMRADTGSTTATCYQTLTNLNATTASAASNCGVTTQCNPTTNGTLCWNGPYMSSPVANDPWGMPYLATYTPATAQVQVQSFGPDKANGNCVSTTDDLCVIQ